MEHWVATGRIDLINHQTHEIYEVKPCTWGNWNIQSARDQVGRYLECLDSDYHLGTEIGITSVTFPYKNYTVTYWLKEEGIIYYAFKLKKKEVQEFEYQGAPSAAPKKNESSANGRGLAKVGAVAAYGLARSMYGGSFGRATSYGGFYGRSFGFGGGRMMSYCYNGFH